MGDRVADDDAKGHHAAKGKHPLGDADGNEARAAEAVLDGALEAAGAAQLAVDDDEADGPVDDDGQGQQQQGARQQAGLAHGVGLADDAGADDGVGHVHERRLQAGLGPPQLGLGGVCVLLVAVGIVPLAGDGDAGGLEVRQQRHAVRVVAGGGGGVVEVEAVVGRQRRRRRRRQAAERRVAEVEDARRQVELHPAGGARRLDLVVELGARRLEGAGDDAEVGARGAIGSRAVAGVVGAIVVAEAEVVRQQPAVLAVKRHLAAVVRPGHGQCSEAASCPVTIFARAAQVLEEEEEGEAVRRTRM